MKVIVDLFGGDNDYKVILQGCFKALENDKDLEIVAVGNEDIIKPEIVKFKERIEILDAKQIITFDDNPAMAVIKKKDSSIVKGLKFLADPSNKADAFVSAGSTGALLAGAYVILNKINGIERPALALVAPTFNNSNVILIDAGANSECDAKSLHGFAIMGSEYIKSIRDVKRPRVAILSNGTEDSKGTKLVKEAAKEISEIKNIDFKGQMEARDLLSGEYDVVVADGFSGNVALKSMEGMAKGMLSSIKNNVKNGGLRAKLGALLLKPVLKEMKNTLDYSKQGGAMFVGLDKIVIKAHGSSGEESISNSILQAVNIAKNHLVEKIAKEISNG